MKQLLQEAADILGNVALLADYYNGLPTAVERVQALVQKIKEAAAMPEVPNNG